MQSQGLSLDGGVIDIGRDIFENGMAYVALSRFRRLEAVYLVDFDVTWLKCTVIAFDEMNKKRKTATPDKEPEFSVCNRLPPSYRALAAKRKRPPGVSGGTVVRSTMQSAPAANSEGRGGVLKLRNEGNICYSNAAVQGFLQLTDFCDGVLATTGVSLCVL